MKTFPVLLRYAFFQLVLMETHRVVPKDLDGCDDSTEELRTCVITGHHLLLRVIAFSLIWVFTGTIVPVTLVSWMVDWYKRPCSEETDFSVVFRSHLQWSDETLRITTDRMYPVSTILYDGTLPWDHSHSYYPQISSPVPRRELTPYRWYRPSFRLTGTRSPQVVVD